MMFIFCCFDVIQFTMPADDKLPNALADMIVVIGFDENSDIIPSGVRIRIVSFLLLLIACQVFTSKPIELHK